MMLDFSSLPDLSKKHPDLVQNGGLLYVAHMQAREDMLIRVFGEPFPNGEIRVPIDGNLLLNWPGGGVFQYRDPSFLQGYFYVTHGLAQPDDLDDAVGHVPPEPDQYSGMGVEMVISSNEKAPWAFEVLINIVKYLLFQENARIILPGDRFPCNGPLVAESGTKLNHLIAVSASEYEHKSRLPGGLCHLVHLVGVTEAEVRRAEDWGYGTGGTRILEQVLREFGVGVHSLVSRNCLTEEPNFERIWTSTRMRLEKQWSASS